jgi:hypothetical protein
LDVNDALPLDASETLDTDGDLIGNNADTDDGGDGYADADELVAGTNSLSNSSLLLDTDGDFISNATDSDDDNDGLPDIYELANGIDPLVASDGVLDNDTHDLSNFEEFRIGTDINVADTDGDGINDIIDNNPLFFDVAIRVCFKNIRGQILS